MAGGDPRTDVFLSYVQVFGCKLATIYSFLCVGETGTCQAREGQRERTGCIFFAWRRKTGEDGQFSAGRVRTKGSRMKRSGNAKA